MIKNLTNTQIRKRFKNAFVLSRFQDRAGNKLATIQYSKNGRQQFITTPQNSRLYNIVAGTKITKEQSLKSKAIRAERLKRKAEKNLIKLENDYVNINNELNQIEIKIGKFKNPKNNISTANTTIKKYPLGVFNANLDYLTDLIYIIISDYRKQIVNIGFGDNTFLKYKLIFTNSGDYDDPDIKIIKSIVLNSGVTKEDIKNKLLGIAQANYDTPLYIIYLSNVSAIASPLSNVGGCNNSKYTAEKLFDEEGNKIIIKSYKSTGNNCLFACFNKHYNIKGNQLKSSSIRKELNFKDNEKINIDDLEKVLKYYNDLTRENHGLVLINQEGSIIKFIKNGDDFIKLMIRNEHYYSFTSGKLKNKCLACGTRYINEHNCDPKRIKYYQKKIIKNKKNNIITERNQFAKQARKLTEKINYDSIVNFDMETFVRKINKKLDPYAIGWDYKNCYYMRTGKKCIGQFIKWLDKRSNLILNAFNGSRFDYYFLIDELIKMNIPVKNIILNNGRVISFEFGQNNRVFDLCLFINSSLKKACEDFNTDISKSSFDHKLINSWDDVYKHYDKWEPYLKLDVLSMKNLFIKFNDMMYELENVNITEYMTLSHMGYEIWLNTLEAEHIFEIPDLQKYEFIKRGTYGGRTYPHQKEFKSSQLDDILKLNSYDWDNIKMFMELPFCEVDLYESVLKSNDFYFNGDVSSLYPASMAGFELCEVKYPCGNSEWVDNKEAEKNYYLGKCGFFEINYYPPKDITVAILPHRKTEGGIEWSLNDNTGVYTNVDIKNAIDAGYKIEFINKALIYESSTSTVFKSYIEKFCKLKKIAGDNGEACKRAIAKLLLNSLYGKQLQKAIFNNTSIINSVFEFNDFVYKYELTDWQEYGENKFILSGESKEKETKITKAPQLGAFVTSYSRKIMLVYMKAIDPTLKSIIFSYTDTDSLHIPADAYHKLKQLGYIKTEEDCTLGFLCSDIKNEGLIIYEKNLGPKSYHYTYINDKNIIGQTNKTKGIPQRLLIKNMFVEEKPVEKSFSSLRKINKHITKQQQTDGLNNFNIVEYEMKRTFNKSEWSGMQFNNNIWLPHGYVGNLL